MKRRRRAGPGRETRPRNLWDTLYPTLDLHGLTEPEAVATARRWLDERAAGDALTVRIVTGRGLHSKGPAVLPAAIDGLLRSLRGTLVLEHDREPGGGAYRVRLRGRRTAGGGADLRAPADLGPELARAAEESLAELGITPTPALLEAEAQRIVRDRGRKAK